MATNAPIEDAPMCFACGQENPIGLKIRFELKDGRVTGKFTLSTSEAEMSPSLMLAVFHGVLGQLFFALMTAIAVFTSRAWTMISRPSPRCTIQKMTWPPSV